jgi:hypothetical protein
MPDDLGVDERDVPTDEEWRAKGYVRCGCGEWLLPDRLTFCDYNVTGRCEERWCEACLKERLCAGITELADKCMLYERCPACLLDIDKRDRLRRRAEGAEHKLAIAVRMLYSIKHGVVFAKSGADKALEEIGR